jgi:hypothetical protein
LRHCCNLRLWILRCLDQTPDVLAHRCNTAQTKGVICSRYSFCLRLTALSTLFAFLEQPRRNGRCQGSIALCAQIRELIDSYRLRQQGLNRRQNDFMPRFSRHRGKRLSPGNPAGAACYLPSIRSGQGLFSRPLWPESSNVSQALTVRCASLLFLVRCGRFVLPSHR